MTDSTPDTGTAQQQLNGGHFPNATLPPQPFWNGAPPPAPVGGKQGYVLWLDVQGTFYNALLGDTGQGKVLYAVKVPTGKVSTFMGSIGGTLPRIDIIRVPPAPPPGGDDWIARFGLEVVLDTADVASRAYFTSSF